MTLTIKQAGYVEHRMRGATQRDAAIQAGYSARTAAAAGARLAKHPKVVAELDRLRSEAQKAAGAATGHDKARAAAAADPRDLLLQTMRDPGVDLRLRVDAAKALLPFTHRKLGEAGRKESRQDAATTVVGKGKFAPAAPPANVVAMRRPSK